ncbi:hypothetical protein GIY62_28390 [Burkholderia plantarii]|uniref:hypothetical protein n=1 Tax=Burkholderia plantarii TaxID=41899 RepID=UPI000F4E901A|nr:hypothetical protein [Burkholderia plantarii]WLE61389.1 hypothetical protein GIY62_28390 [Burkholderia plantarii]
MTKLPDRHVFRPPRTGPDVLTDRRRGARSGGDRPAGTSPPVCCVTWVQKISRKKNTRQTLFDALTLNFEGLFQFQADSPLGLYLQGVYEVLQRICKLHYKPFFGEKVMHDNRAMHQFELHSISAMGSGQ